MDRKILIVTVLVLFSVAIIGGCVTKEYNTSNSNETEIGIANPAAVYCEELGYEYKIITDCEGGQKGICVFPDKSECDAWDFFTGKCGKEYTYCEMHGGKIITTTEGCSFSSECAVCVLPNGTKINEWDYFKGECPLTTIPVEKNKIHIHVHVLKDQPKDKFTYEFMSGTPTEVGVYKFYLKCPDLPGSGTFEKVDVITLQKIENDTYYGEKFIKKINETLCIGYPSMKHPSFGDQNFIDGKAVAKVNKSNKEINITVHFWETWLRID